jgi:uncharacterized delta-60 repeat protein
MASAFRQAEPARRTQDAPHFHMARSTSMSLLRAVAAIVAILACSHASANNGDPDPSFGSGGTVIVNYDFAGGNLEEFGSRVLVQTQGYVLVGSAGVVCCATFEYDTVVTRVDRSGVVDGTFGTSSGLTKVSATGQFDFVGGASIAPDGSLLVAVHGAYGGDPGAVVKLSADGIPDATFGVNGVQVIPNFAAADVIGLSDGKILVSGFYNSTSLAVLRLNSDGSADTTFGNQTPADGFAMYFGVSEVNAMLLQADGKIIVAGAADSGTMGGDDFFLVRFTATGDVDTTFNSDVGYVRINFDRCGANATYTFQNRDTATAMTEQNGDILVVGTSGGSCDAPTGNLGSAIGAARLHADGTLDNSFGTPLLQYAPGYDTQAGGVATQGGKIFVAATAAGGYATGNDIGLMRLNHSGTPDLFWAAGGYAHYDTGLSKNDSAAAIALDGAAPLVIGSRDVAYPDTDIAVLRVVNDSIFGDGFD